MDPSQQQPEQTQASSYAYDPNQSTYVYYQPSYQYAYYDPAQQAAYDAYYQQPHQEQPPPANPSGTQFPAQSQPDPVSAAAAAQYQYSYYQQPQPQGMEYGGVYAPVPSTQKWCYSPTCVGNIEEVLGDRYLRQESLKFKADIIMQSSSHRGGRGGRRGGRGGGRRSQPQSRASAAPPGPVRPPPHMAWCELCRVECNTLEILEQHKGGKKHQKNVKVQQELQRVMAAKASQVQATEEGSSVPPPPAVENNAVNGGEGQGSGQKRKMRGGGRGGKSSRRKLNEPPKPKGGHIPLICELCNVTCETQLVFQTHLKGKKHIANRKRFEESEAVFGHAATQALYPALQPILPAIPPDPQSNHLPGAGPQDLPLVFNHVPPTVAPVAAEPAAAALMNTTTPTTALTST